MHASLSPEDRRPETGLGSPLVGRVSINLRRLRLAAGIERAELARRAALHANDVWQLESDDAHEPRVTTALRLAHSLDASLDQLAERIYWDPGQVWLKSKGRPRTERLSGFFLILPDNVPAFEPAPSCDPVSTRQEAAEIFGANVRHARERRHLTQHALGCAAGLSKDGLSLIERGVRETTVNTLLALARALEVPPELLFEGISWRTPPLGVCPRCRQARRPACGLHRRPPEAPVQNQRRRRRDLCKPAPPTGGQPADAGRLASREDIAVRLAANVALRREEVGLSLRQLGEATETDPAYLHRIERGRAGLPQFATILRLAASLKVRYGLLAAGIAWDPGSSSFRVGEGVFPPHTDRERLDD